MFTWVIDQSEFECVRNGLQRGCIFLFFFSYAPTSITNGLSLRYQAKRGENDNIKLYQDILTFVDERNEWKLNDTTGQSDFAVKLD